MNTNQIEHKKQQNKLVGLHWQYYKFLCAVVTMRATLVNPNRLIPFDQLI